MQPWISFSFFVLVHAWSTTVFFFCFFHRLVLRPWPLIRTKKKDERILHRQANKQTHGQTQCVDSALGHMHHRQLHAAAPSTSSSSCCSSSASSAPPFILLLFFPSLCTHTRLFFLRALLSFSSSVVPPFVCACLQVHYLPLPLDVPCFCSATIGPCLETSTKWHRPAHRLKGEGTLAHERRFLCSS